MTQRPDWTLGPCWIWDGPFVCGYGKHVAIGEQRAHRISYRVFKSNGDEIPEGMLVRHACDRKNCVNPDHLELGTHADNMNDMTSRNRQASGERNGMNLHPESRPTGARNGMRPGCDAVKRGAEKRRGRCKVPRENWSSIYTRWTGGESLESIADDFGCCATTIWKVCRRHEREQDS